MFIEFTRMYRTTDRYEHKMLLNVRTIMKVEPCDLAEGGNCRIVLDRTDEDGNHIVMYTRDLYSQVSHRIKVIFNPPNRRKTK